MQAQLNKILEEAKEQLQQAASVSDVDEIRVKLLGKRKPDRDPQRDGEAVTGRTKDNRSNGKLRAF